MIYLFFVALLVGSAVGDSTGIIVPCKKDDAVCINKSAQSAFHKFVKGSPDLGLDSIDPLYLEEIVGDLSTLKFKFTNSSAVGINSCDISDVKLDIEGAKMSLSLLCRDLKLLGHYTINGQLIILPVQGEGEYSITTKQYYFTVDADLKQIQGSDGKPHISVKNFKFTSEVRGGVVYDFQNLFNGNKELADAVLKFANDNWKEVADFVQEPVIQVLLTKAVKHLNKMLKLVTVDELYLN